MRSTRLDTLELVQRRGQTLLLLYGNLFGLLLQTLSLTPDLGRSRHQLKLRRSMVETLGPVQ